MKVLNTALRAQLSASSTTLYGLVGARVYDRRAPEGTVLPYVVYNAHGGGDLNQTQVDFIDIIYNVQALATTQGVSSAIDEAIRARLHNMTFTVTGWNLISIMRETEVQYDELVNGVVVFHEGALYRVRLSRG